MSRPEMPRIAMLAPGELFGGVETQLLGLCTELAACARPPVLVLFHDRESAARARDAGVDVKILSVRHRYDPDASRILDCLLEESAVDVLHVHGYRATITAALSRRRPRIPVVKTEHGLPEPGGGLVKTVKTRMNRRLDAWATRSVRAAVRYVTTDIMTRCDPVHAGLDRMVIHNGIAPLDGSGRSRPSDLPDSAFNVGIVGRISEVKGLPFALEAMTHPSMPESVILHILGTGPLEEPLAAEVARRGLHDRVRFHGFRRDVPDWLAHLDALLMPSLHEGLPYTLLEAMSLGTPSVVSRVGGLAEVLEHDRTGLLVEVGDAGGIATALARLAGDPDYAEAMGVAAAAEQRRGYTLESMTRAYLDTYRSVSGR